MRPTKGLRIADCGLRIADYGLCLPAGRKELHLQFMLWQAVDYDLKPPVTVSSL
jgi:hypothetical protein